MHEPVSPPPKPTGPTSPNLGRDLVAGLVVFLVALPLCLGIALASGAPLISGVISGIVGGLIVGALSGSQTSVSGPAAGLTAIILAQITLLGSFEAFLLAVVLAGVIQVGLGLARAGVLATFVPTSVIKGLLAAIGVILILKQIPHVFGHDSDPEGEMAFEQPDHENTFTELLAMINDLHMGAAVIGLLALGLLLLWDRWEPLKKSGVPAPLAAVLLGLGMSALFNIIGGPWAISESHLVQVPEVEGLAGLADLLRYPDFSKILEPGIYTAAVTIAIVASLETLLNLEAVDRLDPQQRKSPPNRELLAQGAGNIIAGMFGGIPVTAVIIRGSVNIHSGATTKRSAIFHGVLLVASVALLPFVLNRIPLSCLAAILLVTGFRLASPALMKKMWAAGREQFVPFAATVVAIVFTDLLIGLGLGMAVSLGFILRRQSRRPVRRIAEQHLAGEVLHIELPDQVSFLNQVAIEGVLEDIPRGSQVVLDARHTDYIDPDVLALIEDYRDVQAPAREVKLTMMGFHEEYEVGGQDTIQVDYSARELRERSTVAQVFDMIWQGHHRFVTGNAINRVFMPMQDVSDPAPIAAVLSCVDGRVSAKKLFDTTPGDLLNVAVAGAVVTPGVLASLEYAGSVEGVRLIVVLGHTRSGVITASVDEQYDVGHLGDLLADIRRTGDIDTAGFADVDGEQQTQLLAKAARNTVLGMVERVARDSEVLAKLTKQGRLGIVGAVHDVDTDALEFLIEDAVGFESADTSMASMAE